MGGSGTRGAAGTSGLSAPGRGKERRVARLCHRCPRGRTQSAIADARGTPLSKLFSGRSACNAITRVRGYGESPWCAFRGIIAGRSHRKEQGSGSIGSDGAPSGVS